MSNEEALAILRRESEIRKNMAPLSPLLELRGGDPLSEAIDVAIEALELCVMVEDDGK